MNISIRLALACVASLSACGTAPSVPAPTVLTLPVSPPSGPAPSVPEPALSAAPATPAPASSPAPLPGEVSFAQILADPRRYEGKRITLRGSAQARTFSFTISGGKAKLHTMGSGMCTSLFCGPGPSCCNHCHRDLSLLGWMPELGHEVGITLLGAKVGCGSEECNYTCTPAENKAYRVTGVLRIQAVGEEMGDDGRLRKSYGIHLHVEAIAPE